MYIDADVVIVGAGPAGTAAAVQLARLGHRVVLVDRAAFPRDKPCGDYCDPGAVRALGELGTLSDLLNAGAATIAGMRVVAQDGTDLVSPFPHGHGLLFRRLRLDHCLLEHAARGGVEIVPEYYVERVAVKDAGVEIRNGRRPPITGRLLIAADGMRSMTARRLGLYSEISSGRFTIGAYYNAPGALPRGELHLGPGFYCGVARFGEGTANVCMALPRNHFKGRTTAQVFADALRHLPALADELAGAKRVSAFRCTGPVGFRASQMISNRVILAGDAAMQVDPMTGQGIFFALRSGMLAAYTAAHALGSGDFSLRALRAYSHLRAAEFTRKVGLAKILQRLALRPRLTPWLVGRLRLRPGLAIQLLGVTGDVLDPGDVSLPDYLWRLLVSHAPRA